MAGLAHEFSHCVACNAVIEQRAGGSERLTCSYECNMTRIMAEHQARNGDMPGEVKVYPVLPMEIYIMKAAARMVAKEERNHG